MEPRMQELDKIKFQDSSGGNVDNFPTNNKDKVITLSPISSHIFGDIEVKPSRVDKPRSNLGGEGCDQLPGVTSCQL